MEPTLRGLPLTLLVCAILHGCRSGGEAVDEMVGAERAFSETSVQRGMREAFLAHLAEDGVVFAPLPVNGRQLWSSRDSVAGTLIWEPSYAEVSSAGDLGVSLGPWEFRAGADTAHGHFHSIWRKEADGVWRVALDIGVRHERPAEGLGEVRLVSGPSVGVPATMVDASELYYLDAELSEEVETEGMMRVFARKASTDVRWSREGALPLSGLVDVMVVLDGMTGTATWFPQGSGLSASEDLGYTYGIVAHRAAPEVPADSSVYLHVWRHTQIGWHLMLSVENPL
jgi:ketosteroid isomerase-like protein